MADMAIISLPNYLDALAAAKEKSGNNTPMTSGELAQRIRDIETFKPEQAGEATITANGDQTFTPDEGKVFSTFTAKVQVPCSYREVDNEFGGQTAIFG